MPPPRSHPRSPATTNFVDPRARPSDSPMRPKARRALAGSAWPTEDIPDEGAFSGSVLGERRGSPHLTAAGLQPRPNSLTDVGGGLDDWDGWHSMAGQLNARDLRHAAVEGFDPDPMIKACVKVFVTQVTPSYSFPWTRGEEARSTGSGFVVELPQSEDEVHPDAAGAAPGRRCIVTNAHVVESFSLVQVRPAGSAEKFVARVMVIGHDVDLALLHVEDVRRVGFDPTRPQPCKPGMSPLLSPKLSLSCLRLKFVRFWLIGIQSHPP